jgi:single-stranded-DNA-specific exonuclease
MNARGFASEDAIQRWLSPSLKELRDPYELRDMDKAVGRLVEARKRGEPIVVYADYDLDGTSGLALLLTAFKEMGFTDVTAYQPKRLSEGYGLHVEAISRLYSEGRRLLLSVDLGITAIDEVQHANSLGMEVIITDHHLPKQTLPEAVAVVNPNRGDCPSGLSHLCGTGVAFYLVLALRRALAEEGLLEKPFDPKSLLDCFAIGTVTDMVPLVEENRVLVKHGLVQLAQTRRAGLRVLMQALGLWGNPLTSQDVAIRFAPKLNALSRMEMGIQPIDLYLVESESEAHRLVDQVLMNNQTRQASQKSAEDEASRLLAENPPKNAIFVYSASFHRGVVGLVATKLCQEFGLPTFVGSLSSTDGLITGSARMPEGSDRNVLDAMGFASAHLLQFGGHAVAAGFELRVESAPGFLKSLDEYFVSRTAVSSERTWMFDATADLAEFNPGFMTWYDYLSPFGTQFAPPIFCIRNATLLQVRNLKGGHFRLTLSDGGATHAALWFSPAKNHVILADGINAGCRVDALVEPQWNYYAGKKSLQLLVQDLRTAQT